MQTAQRLYEGVDIAAIPLASSPTCGPTASTSPKRASRPARRRAQNFGDRYLPSAPRRYQTKQRTRRKRTRRSARLIRRVIQNSLRIEGDMKRLYELIWKRTDGEPDEGAMLERTDHRFPRLRRAN